jgi:hypothetical protein
MSTTTDVRTRITCYFHCDTTGPWWFKRRWDSADQPWPVRIAVLMRNHDTGMVRTHCWIVRPDEKASFDPGSIRTNALAKETVFKIGMPLPAVMATLDRFFGALIASESVDPQFAAYGAPWHCNVLKAAAIRGGLGIESPLFRVVDGDVRCIMIGAKPIVGKMSGDGKHLSFPKLSEAFEFFTATALVLPDDPLEAGKAKVAAIDAIDVGIRAASKPTTA